MIRHVLVVCCALAWLTGSAIAQPFQVFQGNTSAHASWLAAVGQPVPLETFEGFDGTPSPFSGPSDPVGALPALGITFSTGSAALPGVYTDAQWAHSGVNQLANFGAGLSQFSDYYILPESGRSIKALAFWQCDPQGNQTMYAYDASGTLIGSITGSINNQTGNSFAAFLSQVPIASVRVEGSLGDGWNHIDDLQVLTSPLCDSIDFNNDTSLYDPQDIDAFLSVYSEGPCVPAAATCNDIDFNNDTSIYDPCDIDSFLTVYSEGPCTPCGE